MQFHYFSMKTYFVGTRYKRLTAYVFMENWLQITTNMYPFLLGE